MNWNGVIAAAAGALIALAGVGIAELGQWGRARRAETATLLARAEDRQAELWEISLPVAARIQELFASAVRLSSPPSPWQPPPDGESYDERFPEWWEEKEGVLQRDLALIPSTLFRGVLTCARHGVSHAWDLSQRFGYAPTGRQAALQVAQIGFDAISAWMRDEKSLEPVLMNSIEALRSALLEIEEHYLQELDEFANPKGYGLPGL